MKEHVLDWLSAYHDGELQGGRLRRVESHLRGCAVCQAELQSLRALSSQLQASPPMPARTRPEQFVAQVRLRLPPRPAAPAGRARVRQVAGLWLPLGVLLLWAFGQAVLGVGGLALAVLPADLPLALPPLPGLGPLPALVGFAPPAGWSTTLVVLGLSAGLTVAAAGLVWACLAGWWAARETSVGLPSAV